MVSEYCHSTGVVVSCAYGLGDIIDNNGAVGITIIHGGQRLISLLPGGIPYLKFDCRTFIERYCLSEESGSNR